MKQKSNFEQEEQQSQIQITSRSIVNSEIQLPTSFNQSSAQNNNFNNQIQKCQVSIHKENSLKKHNNFGNLKVFIHRKYFHLSLGPDYGLFCVGISIFIFLSYLLIYIAEHSTFGETMKKISYFIASLVPIFYIITAFSNPGVYNPDFDLQSKYKYCNQCDFAVSKTVRHCNKCNICIQGYDHHCPWISKCVGKGNIIAFYFFLASTPITALYLWLSVGLFFTSK